MLCSLQGLPTKGTCQRCLGRRKLCKYLPEHKTAGCVRANACREIFHNPSEAIIVGPRLRMRQRETLVSGPSRHCDLRRALPEAEAEGSDGDEQLPSCHQLPLLSARLQAQG